MNIIEFIEDPRFIGDKTLSPAQKMSLKAVYGDPLTKKEKKLFRKCTKLRRYHKRREYDEVTFILGRRSGKSSRLAPYLALWEATRQEIKLDTGERAIVMIVAVEARKQAKITFNYVKDKLMASPLLSKMVVKTLSDEIELDNGVTIQVFPCSQAKIRGQSILCFIGDEVAFWKSEEHLQDLDKHVISAARFGMSFPNSKMIKISSPWTTRGVIYEDFEKFHSHSNKDILVIKGDSVLFNPTYKKRAEKTKRTDPQAYKTDVLAEFRDYTGCEMYDPKVLAAAVNSKRPEKLAFDKENTYLAFYDAAGGGKGGDSFCLAVGHIEDKDTTEERFLIDLIEEARPPFDPGAVIGKYASIIKAYDCIVVYGDSFSGAWASTEFARRDVHCDTCPLPKSELYKAAESVFNQGKAELPDDKRLLKQFKSLVRLPRSGGREKVDTPSGQPEDKANVVAGVLYMLDDPPYYDDGEVRIV